MIVLPMMNFSYPLALEHVRAFLATKQDDDELGICYNAVHCLLSETLNWLYTEEAPWRVDVGTYMPFKSGNVDMFALDEPVDFLRRSFDGISNFALRGDTTVTRKRLKEYLEFLEESAAFDLPFALVDLFAEKAL